MSKYFFIALIAAILFLSSVTAWQRNEISDLKSGNSELMAKVSEYQKANAALISEYLEIREEIESASRKKDQAEAESQAIRKRLVSAQHRAECAVVSVPSDVIRMQREAISATNKKFSMPSH